MYYAKFTSIAAKLPSWNDAIRKSKFYVGLHEELKDALIGRFVSDETFDAYAQKCISLDRQLEQRRIEKTGRRAPTMATGTSNSTVGNVNVHAPATSRTAPKTSPFTATGTHSGPMDLAAGTRRKLTDEEKAYRRANNLCLFCRKPGHFAAVCPSKKTRPAHGQTLAEATTTSSIVVVEETKN